MIFMTFCLLKVLSGICGADMWLANTWKRHQAVFEKNVIKDFFSRGETYYYFIIECSKTVVACVFMVFNELILQ